MYQTGRRDSLSSDGRWLFLLLSKLRSCLVDLLPMLYFKSLVVFLLFFCRLPAPNPCLYLQTCFSDCLSTWPADHNLRVFTIWDRYCIPSLCVNFSLLTWSLHDTPWYFQIHRRWNADLRCRFPCLTGVKCGQKFYQLSYVRPTKVALFWSEHRRRSMRRTTLTPRIFDWGCSVLFCRFWSPRVAW